MTALIRLYQCALVAFPRHHRERYAAEMIDSFSRELRGRMPIGIALFTLAASVNVIAEGLRERWRQRRWRLGPILSTLDFTLAWRMLIRYPGLSVVSVLGIAVGIAIAAGAFAVTSAMSNAVVPLPDGARIVSMVLWDASTSNRDRRMIHDHAAWRDMSSITDLSISRTVQRNLIARGQATEVVTIAEISAAAFRVARVPAARGRFLLPEDEAANAEDVVVIGHQEWQRRFDAAPDVVGRAIQLGATTYTVVGVMPEAFMFPLNHAYWIPWRIDTAAYGPRSGPAVSVFARLRDGATIDAAQAEIATIGERVAAAAPDTHQHLRPRVVPYPHAYNDMDDPENVMMLRAIQTAIVLLLIVVCVNVASLVYARTATRQGELAVRSALGAGRKRLVGQLFVEAFLVAGIAAAAGVASAAIALSALQAQLLLMADQVLPFWMTLQLPPGGVLYIVGLTVLAAAIIGVVPGVKATGRRVQSGLQTLAPGSGSRMQMGRVWTTLIVAQVALTVALMPTAIYLTWISVQFGAGDAGFAAREFLTAQLLADRADEAPTADGEHAFTRRLALLHQEVDRRLRSDSRVAEVTFSMTPAGEERAAVLEVEGREPPIDPVDYNIVEGSKRGHLVRFNRVAANFFEAYDVPITVGRTFMASDAANADTITGVVVNRALVNTAFGGANPLGARVRYVGRSREANARDLTLNRWYEIVGVVPDFPGPDPFESEPDSRVYHAAAFGDVYPVQIALRVPYGDPMALAPAMRELSAAIDPDLQIRDVATPEVILLRGQGLMRLVGATVTLVMTSVAALAAAGIYAMMSFTVARRRREIGIRTALGANRTHILTGIFARAAAQLGTGAALGLVLAVGLEHLLGGGMFQGHAAVIVSLVIAFMTLIGFVAAVGPARRGLSIQPIEALREE